MYPGDKWNYGDKHENNLSVSKYLIDYKRLQAIEEKKVDFDKEELNRIIKNFIENNKKNNNLFIFYYLFKKNLFSINFNLTDLNILIKFDSNIGIKEICKNEKAKNNYCDLSYDSLLNLFLTGYGYDTLMIGGKFECDKFGSKALSTIFKFQIKNYRNQYYNVFDLISRIFRKFKRNYRVSGLR